MMNKENASMGAAHPQEAKEKAHQNYNSFFNKDASLEIDRLTVELDEAREEKKEIASTITMEYGRVSSDFGAISHYISEVGSQSYNNLNSHCDVLSMYVDATSPSDNKVAMKEAIESLRYMFHMLRHDLEETSSTAYSLMVKYLEKCASDSAEEYEAGRYQVISNNQRQSSNGV